MPNQPEKKKCECPYITVCDNCESLDCWNGFLMCDIAKTAVTKQMKKCQTNDNFFCQPSTLNKEGCIACSHQEIPCNHSHTCQPSTKEKCKGFDVQCNSCGLKITHNLEQCSNKIFTIYNTNGHTPIKAKEEPKDDGLDWEEELAKIIACDAGTPLVVQLGRAKELFEGVLVKARQQERERCADILVVEIKAQQEAGFGTNGELKAIYDKIFNPSSNE